MNGDKANNTNENPIIVMGQKGKKSPPAWKSIGKSLYNGKVLRPCSTGAPHQELDISSGPGVITRRNQRRCNQFERAVWVTTPGARRRMIDGDS
jgi:uncharacterized cupin superfamily protein